MHIAEYCITDLTSCLAVIKKLNLTDQVVVSHDAYKTILHTLRPRHGEPSYTGFYLDPQKGTFLEIPVSMETTGQIARRMGGILVTIDD